MELQPASDGTLRVVLSGAWSIREGLAREPALERHRSETQRLAYDATAVTHWDSTLIELLLRVERWAEKHKIETNLQDLPAPILAMLRLALAAPAQPPRRPARHPRLLYRLGTAALGPVRQARDLVRFFGEVILAIVRLFGGQTGMRVGDLFAAFQQAGPEALPIVSLIAVLIGLIMGFVGAVQLRRFGAEIYVANLVGIAMTREMGALMTAIIMAGRTAAANSANLGTMKANDEISALVTTGLDPVEFLVMPRVLALMATLPLLVIFADLIGILGGLMLGVTMLHLDWQLYVSQTERAVDLSDFFLGLVKSVFFGAILGVVGCWCGLGAARHAQGVGDATTQAVVLCIVLVLVTDAIFTVITTSLGI